MSRTPDDTLEDRLRNALAARGDTYVEQSPPPIEARDRPTRRAHRPKRALVAVGAFTAVLAIVVAVVAINASDDASRPTKLVPPSERPLFPDVVKHEGPELLLSPQQVPAGYHLLLATGPDANSGGSSGSIGGPTTLQYWVQFDATGTTPQRGFSLGWGPADPAESNSLPPGLSVPHGDALDGYRLGATLVTIAGHDAYWSPRLDALAWEQNGQLVVVEARTDGPLGTWPAHLSQADVQAIAEQVVRNADGTYQLASPPAGYRLAAQVPSLASTGTNTRRLIYSDGNGHGFSVQLVDDTETPPGVALMWPGAQLVTVRDQTGVLTSFLNGGDGSGCPAIDAFLCSSAVPGTSDHTYLQWLEPDSTRVTITAFGLTDQQVLDIGHSLSTISPADWKKLTDASATIPCAQIARCATNP